MKNKAISILAITCIMETAQIIFHTPWRIAEAVPTFIVFGSIIYYSLQELDDIRKRRKDV